MAPWAKYLLTSVHWAIILGLPADHRPRGNAAMALEKIEITHENARKYILGSIEGDPEARFNLIDAVIQWVNCREVDIGDDGRIWIANPHSGHWLSDEKLVEFLNWCDKQ
jgi:hypothetical protein